MHGNPAILLPDICLFIYLFIYLNVRFYNSDGTRLLDKQSQTVQSMVERYYKQNISNKEKIKVQNKLQNMKIYTKVL